MGSTAAWSSFYSIRSDLDKRRTSDLIPHVLDHLAATNPDGLFAEYPISAVSYEEGYHSVTYKDFANAVNGLAHWIRDTLGEPQREYQVLAYMGPNDLRYPALVLAAIKAGYILFLTSSRNSVPAQVTLLERLECSTMLSPNPRPPQVQALANAYVVDVVEVPGVKELLSNTFDHFDYGKTYPEELDKPMFIAHTSGSTGFPKPLFYKHGSAITNTNLMSLQPPKGYRSVQGLFEGKRMFMTFPPFHAAYFVVSLFNCLPLGTVFLSPIAGAIPSAQGLVEGLKKTRADVAFIVPSIVLELAQSPEMLDYCAQNLEFLMYCGGDLPRHIGDVVASKIKLVNQYGASEIGVCGQIESETTYDRADWKYVHFHPETGYEFHHVVDDTFELRVIHHEKFENQQPTFTIFPGTTEYGTRDLFVRHPTKPDLWAWKARADDIIVFLNGEKTNPISMEQHIIARNPEVTAALVIGAQRFQAALLLELNMGKTDLSVQERAAFIEKAWPSIEEANQECPAHAKVAKTHILFTRPGKPMLRAGKGTIQRAGTLAQYEAEIDALYADADKLTTDISDELARNYADKGDVASLTEFVRDVFARALQKPTIDENDNFFQLGLDSFQALIALRSLRQAFHNANIALSTIYTHPSVTELVKALVQLSHNQQTSERSDIELRLAERNAIFKELTESFSLLRKNVVILTGSTGSLGSHLLTRLLADPSVDHVFCLNRNPDSKQLQIARNTSRGLPTKFPEERTTFLAIEPSHELLGLTPDTYEQLCRQATLIIHAAWPVNFNLPLSAFRPSLRGMLPLLKLAAAGKYQPHFHYVSSISSVMIPDVEDDSLAVPERILPWASTPLPTGYGESKQLAEQLLAEATKRLNISSSVSRVGQVAGSVDGPGIWNPAEWFPSLVLSSVHIGAIPQSLGKMDRVDWIPIDRLADVLLELTLLESKEGADKEATHHRPTTNGMTNGNGEHTQVNASQNPRVFHLVYPRPTTWAVLLPHVVAAIKARTGTSVRIVPAREWLSLIREDMADGKRGGDVNNTALTEEQLRARLATNPAVKLLDFYEDILGRSVDGKQATVLDIQETLARSGSMKKLGDFQANWVTKWVGEWLADREHVNGNAGLDNGSELSLQSG